jgi:hypothetical protein
LPDEKNSLLFSTNIFLFKCDFVLLWGYTHSALISILLKERSGSGGRSDKDLSLKVLYCGDISFGCDHQSNNRVHMSILIFNWDEHRLLKFLDWFAIPFVCFSKNNI